jgi:hypothetical protein
MGLDSLVQFPIFILTDRIWFVSRGIRMYLNIIFVILFVLFLIMLVLESGEF